MDILKHFIPYLIAFMLGRFSYNVYRNRYLEEKKEDLIRYHAMLLSIEEGLEKRDDYIRSKWQSMVDDISKYKASVEPDGNDKWNEWDDLFLESWGSAEK